MNKKFLAVGIIALSLLVLAGCGGAKKGTTTTGDVITVTDTTQTPDIGNKKAASKDQCIELMADAFMVAQFQAQNDSATMAQWAQKASDLEKKYGDSNIEYEETCGKLLTNDPSFMQTIQKRMEELK